MIVDRWQRDHRKPTIFSARRPVSVEHSQQERSKSATAGLKAKRAKCEFEPWNFDLNKSRTAKEYSSQRVQFRHDYIRLSEIRLRETSTSRTFTFSTSPTVTISFGSETNSWDN